MSESADYWLWLITTALLVSIVIHYWPIPWFEVREILKSAAIAFFIVALIKVAK